MKTIKLICLFAILSLSLGFKPMSDKVETKTESQLLNYESLWQELKQSNVKWPEVVFAQAVLESGHFKSIVCRKNNNLFGMRFPVKRETIAKGKNMGYATYTSWQHSVQDYKLWQDYLLSRKDIPNRVSYFILLDRIYSETPGYSNKLKQIINNFSYLKS